jgi:hypothetical protein
MILNQAAQTELFSCSEWNEATANFDQGLSKTIGMLRL